ncbi:YciI family protein [Devosia sp.]|uniref:YciI family protein n=1 Tax=Devosia sp. TaxID=1871048 RepID=UPI001ACCB941|nr:YciI family protein [Devosia sp.]MBN9311011.1 YciI family protein [Devosia sp.]
MRFMIIRKADAETEAEVMPSTELIEAMTAYNEKLSKAGVLVGGDGLLASSRGARIKFANGRPTVTDGPFAEAKELIAGYTMIEVASREEALEWVRQWPPEDGHGSVELELRQVATAEDFGDAMTPELIEREAAMRIAEHTRK